MNCQNNLREPKVASICGAASPGGLASKADDVDVLCLIHYQHTLRAFVFEPPTRDFAHIVSKMISS